MKDEFILVLKGQGSKKTQGLFLVCIFAFFIVCLGITQLLFPGGYVWTERFISEEGNHVKNPVGWIFFTLGVCTSSVLLIPQSLYIYRHLQPKVLFLTRINLFFLLVGSVGLFIVGAISEEYPLPHNTGSAMAFGGFGLGAFCSFLICFRRLFLKEPWPTWPQFLFLFSILLTMGIIVAVGMATHSASEAQRFQWIGLWIIAIYYLGMYLIIPDKKK
jgi:hypothetical protein